MNCRVCRSNSLEVAVDLRDQPWANHFLKKEEIGTEPLYPLRVVYCTDCKTAQLDYAVPKEVMFADHTYLSGVTRTLSEHFEKVAQHVDHAFFQSRPHKTVLDIGSNDGTQLRHFQSLGYDLLGVESCKTAARIANDNGINTLNRFFNFETAEVISKEFEVINAAGVFFHLEELHSAAEGIKKLLAKDGVFIVQFLYMKCIMENMAFDQIYHEHLLYYNLATLNHLIGLHGLALFDAYVSPIHGGSVISFATHMGGRHPTQRLQVLLQEEERTGCNELSSYRSFASRIDYLKEDTLSYLDARKKSGKTIYGFGAPVKGNTLLNYFGIGTRYLDCLVEKNELRRGLFSPGMHIPIAIEKELGHPPDVYFVLAWNFKKEILENNRHLLDQGVEFHFPVNPREIP